MPVPKPEAYPAPHELTLVEEITLLALDDQTGQWLDLPLNALAFGLAGAVIADLFLARRIDTDPQQLTVLDPTPVGDATLDPWLARLARASKPQTVAQWIHEISWTHFELRQEAVKRLMERGILRMEKSRMLWAFGTRRYPTVDGRERVEVRTRLGRLFLGEELPEPRDATLISLLSGCRLLEHLFSGPEFAARQARIDQLAKMDLVGRDVAAATRQSMDILVHALAATTPQP
jgi:golgi phosphoprotein 3